MLFRPAVSVKTQVMVETGRTLSDLACIMEMLPQALVNAKVADHKKEKYLDYPRVAEAIRTLETKFAGGILSERKRNQGFELHCFLTQNARWSEMQACRIFDNYLLT